MHPFSLIAAVLLLACLGGILSAAAPPKPPALPQFQSAPIDPASFPADATIKLACVGDSITAGSGSSAPHDQSNAYPSQLQRMLDAGASPRFDVHNFGISGATLLNTGDKPYQKQQQFPDSKSFKPDVVVIMLGTNDTKPQNWKFKDQFPGDLKNLVAAYAALESKPRIFICRPCAVFDAGAAFDITQASLLEELPMIDAAARELHLGLIDVYAATKDHQALFPDNVHPNNDGAALLASTVYQALTGHAYQGPSTILALPSAITSTPGTSPATAPAR